MGAVFVARDVSDIGLPARRVRSALQALAATAANRGRVFVTVKPRAGGIALKQALATSVCPAAVDRLTTSVRGHPRATAAK